MEMFSGLSDVVIMRIVIGLAFLILVLYIVLNGRSKSKAKSHGPAVRVEPQTDGQEISDDLLLDSADAASAKDDFTEQAPLEFEDKQKSDQHSRIGVRKTNEYEKIIMLYLAAKSGQSISGAELVLATEKVGLIYGHHNIYHRLSESARSNEPVFSMANVIQPGYFDLAQIDSLQTPGVSFFMTLPGPVTAIQAWDTMLPIAERMAQLLDAVLLDSDRNALGRQRILHIKEELRTFDREKERQTIKPGR
jgi:cell division protein ZipA